MSSRSTLPVMPGGSEWTVTRLAVRSLTVRSVRLREVATGTFDASILDPLARQMLLERSPR